MEIKQEKRNDVIIFSLDGEFVGGPECVEFTNKIGLILKEYNMIVADFLNVSYMNASGLGMLITVLTTVRNNGGDLKLAKVQKRVRDLIQITKMDRVFKIFDTVDQAIKAFK